MQVCPRMKRGCICCALSGMRHKPRCMLCVACILKMRCCTPHLYECVHCQPATAARLRTAATMSTWTKRASADGTDVSDHPEPCERRGTRHCGLRCRMGYSATSAGPSHSPLRGVHSTRPTGRCGRGCGRELRFCHGARRSWRHLSVVRQRERDRCKLYDDVALLEERHRLVAAPWVGKVGSSGGTDRPH